MVIDCLVKVARRGSFMPRTSTDGSIIVPIKLGSDRESDGAVAADPPSRAN
jgi:hypothetical protein